MECSYLALSLLTLALLVQQVLGNNSIESKLKSEQLCSQCSVCEAEKCPPSFAYPHMTGFDNSLIAGSMQSDYVSSEDKGVYAVPNIVGGESEDHNSYFGWESTSGSESGYHRFRNYMVKCSEESYLAVDKHGKVALRGLKKLESWGDADWKSINPPKKYNHREFRFWVNRSSGKCLTVLNEGSKEKRALGVDDCAFDGSKPYQLFAFRFHYHKAFCCCGKYNE